MILETDKEKLGLTLDERKKKNSAVYDDPLLAMTDDVIFCLVDESGCTDYPEGDARVAWSKLMQRFESQTNAFRVKLMGQFSSLKLKNKHQDPDSWI